MATAGAVVMVMAMAVVMAAAGLADPTNVTMTANLTYGQGLVCSGPPPRPAPTPAQPGVVTLAARGFPGNSACLPFGPNAARWHGGTTGAYSGPLTTPTEREPLCLAVTAPGQPLSLALCENGSTPQQFRIADVNDLRNPIVHVASGDCVDASGPDGVVTAPCKKSPGQTWTLGTSGCLFVTLPTRGDTCIAAPTAAAEGRAASVGRALTNCTPKDLLLDMYSPAGRVVSGRPALILAHGGGNSGGSKEQNCFQGTAKFFAARGFVAFNIDYRLKGDNGPYPGAMVHLVGTPPTALYRAGDVDVNSMGGWTPSWASGYPAVRDMKAAVRYVRANAERFGVDPNKIAVSGGSAGATNAVATGVTFDGDYKDELTVTEDPTLTSTHLNESSGVQAVYAHWSSDGEVSLVQQHDPRNRSRFAAANAPIVEFHGTEDTTISISHAYAVWAEYNKTGVPYELHPLEGWAHGAWCYGCEPGCANGTTAYCPVMDQTAYPFLVKHLGMKF